MQTCAARSVRLIYGIYAIFRGLSTKLLQLLKIVRLTNFQNYDTMHRLQQGKTAMQFYSRYTRKFNLYLSYIAKGPDECWPWIAKLDNRGYGVFYYPKIGTNAHRVSWALHNNQYIPKRMWVLHKCNNKACVNPAHLRLGTHIDNVKDHMRARQHSKKARAQLAFQARVYDLRSSGLSYENIAKAVTAEGRYISRQRVHQLIKAYAKRVQN